MAAIGFGKRAGDFTAIATEQEERAVTAEQLDAQLSVVNRAIAKVAEGSYGRCDDCGNPIGAARIEALPTAVRCVPARAAVEPRTAAAPKQAPTSPTARRAHDRPSGASTVPATADAIVIGAGVIGAAVGFELSKRGLRTLNIDKNPASGYGSTSSSSACVRAHYSSHAGVAMAHAGFSYWKDWGNYLGVDDERGIARYVNCGTVLLKSDEGQYLKALEFYDALGVAYEDWDTDTLLERAPYYDPHRFWPPSRPSDDRFWEPPTTVLDGAIYTPDSGYMSDPALATHNLQRAAEAAGGRFRFRQLVREIRSNGRVRGVTLDNGDRIDAPIVVNVAGPYSASVNRMAGVEQAMKIRTRPMRHEVHVVPGPPGVDLDVEPASTPRTATRASTSGRSPAARSWSAARTRTVIRGTGSRTPTRSTVL